MHFQLPAPRRQRRGDSPFAGRPRRVVDFSADYRLIDPEVFAKWYGQKHTDAERLGQVAYGLPELYRADPLGRRWWQTPVATPLPRFWPWRHC